ncbi:arylesterase [Aliiruegeria sabulilitoris]|uniref:arylesterase n=1 Tax=Aliiruegeria sabulilitoris TaxID=1510458 RepID=UPI00082B1BAF|nr:arylesterase [Aliiruegeria sabulilitoris]NDR56773.1 arylesterase [Pseudoruegeria sp. M32A2M]
MGRASKLLLSLAYGAVGGVRKAVLAAALLLALPALAEPVNLAALGDSLTQGYGLPPEEGFVPQLEAWLRDNGHDVSITNAGVSGDTTAGGLSRVGWTLTPEIRGMIVALGGNDMLRGIDPANSRENLRGILVAAREAGVEVLLVGIQAPGNYGPDYKAAFDNMYPELAEEFGTLHADNFFAGLAVEGDPSAAATYLQPDGLHPNAAGVSKIVAALGPKVALLLDRIDRD